MIDAEVIIVGGGPAGSTCAWKLREAGVETIILDKQDFPRPKPCAGWITPRVIRDLELDLNTYPHNLVHFDKLHFHVRGRVLRLPTHQYAIRRIEFDHWLLHRAGVPVHRFAVTHIRRDNGYYLLEDAYRCTYLVGAGGTHCPVYRTFFTEASPRSQESQITAVDDEFPGERDERDCHLWFFEGRLSGYSWYVPKGNGYVNIGIGGKSAILKARGEFIDLHWERHVRKLSDLSLVSKYSRQPRGYVYFLRSNVRTVHADNAFIIGDAAGLATRDMGEGIGPAVKSGILAAEAIVRHTKYSVGSIPKYSLFDLVIPGRAERHTQAAES